MEKAVTTLKCQAVRWFQSDVVRLWQDKRMRVVTKVFPPLCAHPVTSPWENFFPYRNYVYFCCLLSLVISKTDYWLLNP